MKKLLLLVAFLFALTPARAQSPAQSSTGNITAQGNTCFTTNACITLNLASNVATVSVTLSGTFSATMVYEQSNDLVNWTTVATVSSGGLTSYGVSSLSGFRVRCTTYTSGTVTVFINSSPIGVGFLPGGDLSGTATSQEVVGLLSNSLPSLTTGYLNWSGSAWALSAAGGTGTVTSMSSGNLSPLFTTSVGTPTITPAMTFSLSNAAQNSVFAGPPTGGAGAPSYQTAPTISAANMTSFPTLNQNTTGSAAKWTTARNLAGNSVDGSANVAFSNKLIVQGTVDAGLSGAQFLGALATGVLKNTTGTGVLSLAAASDIYGLWSGSCTSSTFLRGDGSCQATSGSISGLTTGYIPLAGSATSITGNSHCDDGATTAATVTCTEPLTISASGNGLAVVEGTAPTGVAASDLLYADSTAHRWKMINNNGTAAQVVASGADINTSDQVTNLSHVTNASLANSGLVNAATTVNSQTCTLGSTCTIPFQTNSGNNTSQAGINLLTSTANSVGLTVTPTNSGTNQEKFEVTGSSYTGTSAGNQTTCDGTSSTNQCHAIAFAFGAPGGTALSTGVLGYFTVPFACTIRGWSIQVDAGTATVKWLKVASGTAIPTLGSNSISTSGVAISTGTVVQSTTLTDFTTTTVTQNDIIAADLTTVSGVGYISAQVACSQ